MMAVPQTSPRDLAPCHVPQTEARLRLYNTTAHAPEVPGQTYAYGPEDIQKYVVRAREQVLGVEANET
jgi:hypothetical protein